MNSTEIRFFWLPLSTTKCKGIPFTHICEWKRRSSTYDSSGYSSWICMVTTVAMGSASMICLPLYAAVALGSKSESGFDSEDLILTTNDCFERHSSVLCQVLLWNSHHLPVSFFVFRSPFFSCGEDWLSFSFAVFCGPGFPLPCFYGGFVGPKSHLFFCRNFSSILTAYR